MSEATLSGLLPRAATADRLWQSRVLGCAVDEERCALSVRIQLDALLSEGELTEASRAICAAYALEQVVLAPSYALQALDSAALEYVRAQLAARYPSLALAFEGAEMRVDGNMLTLGVEMDWQFRVEELKTELTGVIQQLTGLPVRMEIQAVGDGDSYERCKEAELKRLNEEWSRAQQAAPRQASEKPKPRSFERKKSAPAEKFTPPAGDDEIIYGRPVARGYFL